MVVTANVILSKTDDAGRTTYTCFYGQSFDPSIAGEPRSEDARRGGRAVRERADQGEPEAGGLAPHAQERTQVCERFVCRTLDEFTAQFPEHIDPGVVASTFTRALSESSNVQVHSIINVCVILLSLVHTGRRAAATDREFGVPRVEGVGEA